MRCMLVHVRAQRCASRQLLSLCIARRSAESPGRSFSPGFPSAAGERLCAAAILGIQGLQFSLKTFHKGFNKPLNLNSQTPKPQTKRLSESFGVDGAHKRLLEVKTEGLRFCRSSGLDGQAPLNSETG